MGNVPKRPISPTPDPSNDSELARRASDRSLPGHGEAFHQLYERHARDVLRFVAARADRQSDAEDLCQNIWIKVHEALIKGGFDGRNFRGWLFRVASNVVIDQARKRKPPTTSLTANPHHEPIDPPDHREETGRLAAQVADLVAAGAHPALHKA